MVVNKAAVALKKHIDEKLLSRFNIKVNIGLYYKINKLAKLAKPSNISHLPNCDFRKIHFNNQDIFCIFDSKLERIKTVLKPINYDVISKNLRIINGEVINRFKDGYLIILDNGSIAVLHNSVNIEELIINNTYSFKVIHSSINKKNNKVRNFVKLNGNG